MLRSLLGWSVFSYYRSGETKRTRFAPPTRLLRFQQLESRTMLSINGDFNGDGADDLAIGSPFEDIGGISNAGAVSIIYGTRRGLSTANNQFWHQNSPGINGVAADNVRFGSALAVGDFNGDGFSDLAIGAYVGKGSVNIIYGSAAGLRATGDQLWNQDSPGIADAAEDGDDFGRTLSAGDFNGDGRDDLAIGVPGEGVGAVYNAGAVHIFLGSATGLTNVGDQYFTQNSSGINDTAETSDRFGSALAAGDFNNDGRDDLAIGVPFENVGGMALAGAVAVLYGSAKGLSNAGDQLWSQNSPGIANSAAEQDRFGETLAAGDFNGDGFDDLAIAAPYEDVGLAVAAGAVHVLFGSGTGISSAGDQFWTQDSPNIPAMAGSERFFGSSLAAGDFDGDGRDDLAIGTPQENFIAVDSGAVYLMYGSSTGLRGTGSLRWSQSSATFPDPAETNDRFGSALTTGDYDGDGRADLVIGVPFENNNQGVLYVLYQGRHIDPLITLWSQLFLSSADGLEDGDLFGLALG